MQVKTRVKLFIFSEKTYGFQVFLKFDSMAMSNENHVLTSSKSKF